MPEYISKTQLHIPGKGHLLVSDPGTKMFTLDAFKFGNDTTHAGWVWLGDASKENPIEFTPEGGEQEVLPTWDRPSARSKDTPGSVTGTITLTGITQGTIELAFPGGKWNAATKSYTAGNGKAVEKQLVVVTEDGSDIAALRLARVSIKGQLPSFDPEAFQSWQLPFTMLDAADGGAPWEWFVPRPMSAGAGGGPGVP